MDAQTTNCPPGCRLQKKPHGAENKVKSRSEGEARSEARGAGSPDEEWPCAGLTREALGEAKGWRLAEPGLPGCYPAPRLGTVPGVRLPAPRRPQLLSRLLASETPRAHFSHQLAPAHGPPVRPSGIRTPIFQPRKLRCKQVKQPVQGHTLSQAVTRHPGRVRAGSPACP